MIDRLFQWALHHRILVLLIFGAIMAAGVASMFTIPIDAVPDITNVSVMVNTKTGALAPEEIEKTVTFPIETELAGLPDVEDIRSLSKYGLSQIIVVFSDSTDVYFARQLVSERLLNLSSTLPEGITPELGPVSTGLGEIFMYAVLPKKGSALESRPEIERLLYLRTVQDMTIKPQLKAVPGVAEVESNGGYKKQIHVNVDPARMNRHGIDCHMLIEKLRSLGENYGGGYIQNRGNQIIVRTVGRVENLSMIRNLPVKLDVYGRPVRVNQIAEVSEGHELRLGAATYNGNETVLGTALMRIGANSRDVSLALSSAIRDIPLPDDVAVKILYSRDFLVNATITTVTKNLLEGGLLVIVILFLILGNFRAAIIVALAIPLSMIAAFAGMAQSGISASLMSLGAIDFGLIVDGSVVVVENVIRRFELGRGTQAPPPPRDKLEMVLDSCREVGKPVVLGVFIIMIVYVPILTLSGIEGKMFTPMALTVLYAIGASLFIAIFLMPVLSYYFLKVHGSAKKEPFFFRHLPRLYRPVLSYSLENRKILIPSTLAFAAITFIMLLRLGSDFIPKLDEGDMVIGLVRDTAVGIDSSVAIQKQSEKIIASFGEVETVFSRMGTPESATDPMGVNFADTFVILKKDRSAWPKVKDGGRRAKDTLFEDISRALEARVPGQEISMTQPIEMRFNEILEGSRADITLRIFGPDLDRLLDMVIRAQGILEKIEGAESVEMDPLTALKKSPVLDLVLNHDAISEYGLSLQDVNDSFVMAMTGEEVGHYYQADRRFPIVVRIEESRRTAEDIGRIPVALPDGGTIPIAAVSEVKQRDQVTTIARSRSRRYAAVSINLRDRDAAGFVGEAEDKINKAMDFPAGYHAEWGGQFKNLRSARARLMLIIPIVLFIIFVILVRSFASVKHALLVFNSIPFAITGGIFFLFIRGIPLSVSAGVGFIALTGIAILDGMVLVSFFNQLRAEGVPAARAVQEGSLARLRPVIMTSLVAMLGFIPMAFNTGLGAEVQRPLATVVIGGILTSTLLTLLLLPTLYLMFEKE